MLRTSFKGKGAEMADYSACPSCGFNKQSSIFTGSCFDIYECSECGHLYCYECPGANGGNTCPECGDSGYRVAGQVQLE